MAKLRPWRKDDTDDKLQDSARSPFGPPRDRDDEDSEGWLSSLNRGGRMPASPGTRSMGSDPFGRSSPARPQPAQDQDKGGGRFSLRKGGDKANKPKEGGGGLFGRKKDKSDKPPNTGPVRRPLGAGSSSPDDKEKKGGLGRLLPKRGEKQDEPPSRSPFIGSGRTDAPGDRLGSPISPNRERLLRSGSSSLSDSPGLRRSPLGAADDDDVDDDDADERPRPGGFGDRDRSLSGSRPSSLGGSRPGSLSSQDRFGSEPRPASLGDRPGSSVSPRPGGLGERDRSFGGSRLGDASDRPGSSVSPRPGGLGERDRSFGGSRLGDASDRPGSSVSSRPSGLGERDRSFGGSRLGDASDRPGSSVSSRPGGLGERDRSFGGSRLGDAAGKKDKSKKEGGKSPLSFLKRGGKDKDADKKKSRSAARPQEAPVRAQKPSATPRAPSRTRPLPETHKKGALSVNQGLDFDRKIDLIGVVLVAFSLVAFFAVIPSMSLGLLPPPEGGLTGAIDALLSQLFGWGKIVLPIAGFGVGVWLMVQSFEATGIELDYFRVIGMLSLFACGLTWLHMLELVDDPAPTVEAFRPISYHVAIDQGQGGGWFGHTFYVFLLSQLGDYGTLSILVAWLVIGLMLTFDVSVVELGRYLVAAFTLVGVSAGRNGRAEKRAAREALKAEKMAASRPGETPGEATGVPRQMPLAATASPGTVAPAPGGPAESIPARSGPRINRRAGGDDGESDDAAETIPGLAATGLAAARTATAGAEGDNEAAGEPRPSAARRLPHLRRGKPSGDGEAAAGEAGGEADSDKKRFGFLRRRGKETGDDQPEAMGDKTATADRIAGQTGDSGEDSPAPAGESAELPGIPVPTAHEEDLPLRPGLRRDPARRDRAFGLPARAADAETGAREPEQPSSDSGDTRQDQAAETAPPAAPSRLGRFLPGMRPRDEQAAPSEESAAGDVSPPPAVSTGKPDDPGDDRAPIRERPRRFEAFRSIPSAPPAPVLAAPPDDDLDDEADSPDDAPDDTPDEHDEREAVQPSRSLLSPLARSALAGRDVIKAGDEDTPEDDKGEHEDAEPKAGDRPAFSVMSPLRQRLAGAGAAAVGAAAGNRAQAGKTETKDSGPDDHPAEEDDDGPPGPPLIGVPRPRPLGERRMPPPGARSLYPAPAASVDDTTAAADAPKPDLEDRDEDGEIDTVRAEQSATVPQEKPGDEETQAAPASASPVRTLPASRPAQATRPESPGADSAPVPVRSRMGGLAARTPAAPPPAREATSGAPTPPRQTTTAQKVEYKLPDFRRILRKGAEQEVNDEVLLDKARIIEDTLSSFGAPGKVVEVNPGPVITQFGVEPDYLINRSGKKTRVKVGSIARLDADLALALAARSIRIEAPVPGRGFVGIEVPNDDVALVSLYDIMDSPEFNRIDSKLRIALGLAVDGTPVAADLAAMPHLLIAGTTGSGKSVCVNAIIACLLLSNTPDDLQFIMVDPKRVELTGYNGIPHLVAPVVVELERIVGVLQWIQREMDERYRKFAAITARNIEDYNKKIGPGERKMPYYVVVVDELADLMMLAPDETERLLARLAQMARATGIHLIISTQRPSVDIITGLIKANFPARIAFAVASSVDSRVILDQPGAEKLLGRGDMLFQSPDAAAPVRMQGVFVSDEEISRITRYWKGLMVEDADDARRDALASPNHDLFSSASGGIGSSRRKSSQPAQRALWDDEQMPGAASDDGGSDGDDMYEEAVELVQRLNKASISLLQRRLRIGYTRAARLIDMMEADGIVGPAESGSKPREVLKRKEPDSSPGD